MEPYLHSRIDLCPPGVRIGNCFYKEGYKLTKDEAIDLSFCLWSILTVGLCFELGVRNDYWNYNKPRENYSIIFNYMLRPGRP